MDRRCARQFCDARAVARVDFDGVERVVWLDVLRDAGTPAAASVLCARHADTFAAPRHWDLRDLRIVAVTVPATPTAPVAPAEPAEPAVPAVSPVLALATDRPCSPWSPHFDRDDDLGGVLDATSPLLARAFRGPRSDGVAPVQ